MSAQIKKGYAGNKGILLRDGVVDRGLFAVVDSVPGDGGTGYGAGCLVLVRNGTSPNQLYKNAGSKTSCAFQALWSREELITAQVVSVPAATTTLTLTAAAHANRTILVASTGGLAVTPPAATGTGNKYKFVCTAAISGGSFTVDAKAGNASDVYSGWMQSYKATTFTPYPTASNSNLITFNGTTTGGAAAGDWFEIQDVKTNLWQVVGYTIQSGTVATMFSNH